MDRPIAMGNCVFAAWEQLDAAFNKWAKGYFGEHVHAEADVFEEAFLVRVDGLEDKDFGKFSALFERFDGDGLYDPNEEFSTGVVSSLLPEMFARGVLSEIYKDVGMRGVGAVQMNRQGVFMMEYALDYNKVMNGEFLPEQEAADGQVMEDAAGGERVSEQGAGWKAEPEVDELVVRMAHLAGELESRNEIETMDWEELCEAIRDAIHEYYEDPSETNPFQVEEVAERVLIARFGEAKPLGEVLSDACERVDSTKVGGVDFELER